MIIDKPVLQNILSDIYISINKEPSEGNSLLGGQSGRSKPRNPYSKCKEFILE